MRRHASRRRPSRRPLAESLEQRALLSGGTVSILADAHDLDDTKVSTYGCCNTGPTGTFNITKTGTDVVAVTCKITVDPSTQAGSLTIMHHGEAILPGTIQIAPDDSLTVVPAAGLTGSDITVSVTISNPLFGCGTSYSIAQADDQITIHVPPKKEEQTFCDCGLSGGDAAVAGGASGSGVAYSSGKVSVRSSQMLASGGFGAMPLGVNLGWTNGAGFGGGSRGSIFGSNMVNPDLPMLETSEDGGLAITGTAGNALFFEDGGTIEGIHRYTPDFFNQDTLIEDGLSGYTLTKTDGSVLTFYGLDSSVPTVQQGQLESYADPEGNATATSYDTSGRLTAMSRSDGTTDCEYDYSYGSGSVVNAGLVSNVALKSGPAGGTLSTVQQVAFAYYGGATNTAFGSPRQLESETLEDADGNAIGTTYYRYYTQADIDGGANGYIGGLKYQLNPESYARAAAALGDPATASDSALAPYADQYYEYDGQRRVTETVVQGAGCSCSGSTGQGTFTYSYSTSSNSDGYNSWKTKTVETLPDGNQNIVYTNYAGEVILEAFDDISDPADPSLDGKLWATYNRYDDQGRLILTAQPSAVAITDLATLNSAASSYADVVGYDAGTDTYQYLSSNSGVIDLTEYGSSTTATAGTAGDVAGYLKDAKVQHGYAGTPILLATQQYYTHTDASGATIHPTATRTAYRNTDGTGAETTTYSYTWFSGTNQMASMTASLPVISTSQDGPGTADVSTEVFDAYGRVIWTKDAGGFLDYVAYDPATGAVVKTIVDVDTTQTGEFTDLPSGWSTPTGGGLNLVTTYQVDGQGRTTEETDPDGNVTYTVYDDAGHEVRVYQGWDAARGVPTGPTLVVRQDYAGSYTETLTMSAAPAISGTAGNLVPTGTEAIGQVQSLTRTLLDNGGRPIETDDYSNLYGLTYSTTAQLGTVGTNYYATLYGYDEMGRQHHVVDPNGTITDTYFDALGRAVSTYVGTTSSTTPSEEWSSGHTGMTLVSQDVYDGGGVGDSNLIQTTQYPDGDSADNRVTQYAYDWRDRLVATKVGVQSTEDTATHRPILYQDMDNLGEVTAISQYDGDGITLSATKPSSGLLRAYEAINYDDQGRPYQTLQYDVNPSTGSVSTSALTTDYDYDHRGDVIATDAPGGWVIKDQYDGAGRLVSESVTDGAGGTAWTDAGSLSGDHVLTQALTAYDADGNPVLVTTKDRFDNDTTADTGPLGDVSTGPKARVSYVAAYYDWADRLVASADVGTNGGSAYSRPATAPNRSDTVLVTTYAYGDDGLLQGVTDPEGHLTQTAYDALGRPVQVISAYDGAVNGGAPTNSANQTTQYAYDGNGNVTSVTAVMPSGTPNQTTAYLYGVTTAAGSGVNSNDLLATVEQPDPATGQPSTAASNQTAYTDNALGQVLTATDPNGTTHTYSYDVLGRQISDAVTTLDAGVDGAVRRLETAYDAAGNPYLFTSYDAASGGNILNQVEDLYNGLGQLVGQYQAQSGAVNTSSTPEVQYAYTEMSGGQNNSRLTSMTYPNGRKVDDVYDSGLDDAISRVSALADDNNGSPGTVLEGYTYLGLSTIVARTHPQPGIDLTYIQQTGDNQANTDGGDRYTGLDRFGRVIDQNWVDTSSGSSVDRRQLTHDANGNVLSMDNLVDTALSELYTYDNENRLTDFAQGTLSGGSIPSPVNSQSWTLDALGNFLGTTTNGSTTNQTFNAQNQATGTGAPTFDADGNTVSGGGQSSVYDAWNRLVTVKDSGGATVASYAYDALGRRITETYSGSSTTNHLYYSPQWQVIEERTSGTANSDVSQQYVWSLANIDALVLRDTYSGGSISQRLYAVQDANDNVVALVDTSGAVQERYSYLPYGAATVRDASGSPLSGNTSAYGWQYLFQGGRLDPVTGNYNFRHRDENPGEGHWEERDPMGLISGDTNEYRFVENTPTVFVDASGLKAMMLWGTNASCIDQTVDNQNKINELKQAIAILSRDIKRLNASINFDKDQRESMLTEYNSSWEAAMAAYPDDLPDDNKFKRNYVDTEVKAIIEDVMGQHQFKVNVEVTIDVDKIFQNLWNAFSSTAQAKTRYQDYLTRERLESYIKLRAKAAYYQKWAQAYKKDFEGLIIARLSKKFELADKEFELQTELNKSKKDEC